MKQLFILLISFGILSAFSSVGKKMPSVSLKTLDGQKTNILDHVGKGKITVISFWATWCSPCKRELDAISEIYPDWQNDYNVEVLAITIDDSRALSQVPGTVASSGWDFTILADTKSDLKEALDFLTIPMTFLVDQNGEIVYEHNGYSPGDEYQLEKEIKKLSPK